MPMTALHRDDDPLRKFRTGPVARIGGAERPIPLTSTRIDVVIRGGLATVVTERTFRNGEPQSIEATMTFPVPIDATLCALGADVDGRSLHAVAQARNAARDTYEDAIDQGHSGILHEEVFAGVHMLSVGHVRPGAEIVVRATWTAALSFTGASPHLRIPMTVGELYGRSPLVDADGLVAGGVAHPATIVIACDDGVASLVGAGAAIDGRHVVTLDAPIDITVAGWSKRQLDGVAADGRRVTVTIEPVPEVDERLDVDLLLDHSGSMSEQACGHREIFASKFDVARVGLAAMARQKLGPADRIRLWQFNDDVDCLGEASAADFEKLLGNLDGPSGGTEMGRAFHHLIANARSRNVVVVTDGKSWTLDPQRIARSGMRVTAVLIGEDALEGMVAAIAGMTGGQVFVAAGSDADAAIAAACAAARQPHRPPQPIEGEASRLEVFRRGARIAATWGAKTEALSTSAARAIGATAAMLAIPLMNEEAASRVAEREGIACHLTSLVLTDTAGAARSGLPATRKIALAIPRTAGVDAVPARLDRDRSNVRGRVMVRPREMEAASVRAPRHWGEAADAPRSSSISVNGSGEPHVDGRSAAEETLRDMEEALRAARTPASAPRAGSVGLFANPATRRKVDLPSLINLLLGSGGGAHLVPDGRGGDQATISRPRSIVVDLSVARGRIEWDRDPEALRQGDIGALPPDLVGLIRSAARVPAIAALARELGIDVIVTIIALIAAADAASNRSAKRLARLTLDGARTGEAETAMRELGL